MAATEGDIVFPRPVGRPKITTADFPDDWRLRVLSEFKMGASREEIYAMLDISDMTFARLMKEDKEFAGTIKYGERLSKAWWLNAGRTQLRNKEFSYVGWYMNMKNRFQWVDKQQTELTGRDGGPIETATLTYMPKQLEGNYFDRSSDEAA